MLEVDLSQLIGGKSFTIYYTLSRNRYGVKTTTFANSRANAFTLLNAKCAQKISKFLNTLFEQLERPIPIKGYNRQVGKHITSILQIYLYVDRRRQYNVPFLVIDLRYYNVILRCKWLAYLDLQLNVCNRQLIQPTNLPPTPSFVREVSITMHNLLNLTLNLDYQADTTQRN